MATPLGKIKSSAAIHVVLLSGLLLRSGTAEAARYIFATFKGDTDPGEKLSIYGSTDATNFTLIADTGFEGSSRTLRDPSIMKYRDGKYYVAYTNPPTASCCGPEDHFSIASSSDLVSWTDVTTVSAGVVGAAHAWAPEWFIEGDTVRIIANIDTLNNDTDFKPYVFTAQTGDLKAWSGPTAMGIGPNYIDATVVKFGATYHCFIKQEATRFIEHATATSITGPWTFVGRDDWAGWGSGREGPSLVQLDDGTWQIFMDGQGSVGFLYATSPNLVTWSRTTPLPALSNLVRHGTVIRDMALGSAVGTDGGSDVSVGSGDAGGGAFDATSATGSGGSVGAGGGGGRMVGIGGATGTGGAPGDRDGATGTGGRTTEDDAAAVVGVPGNGGGCGCTTARSAASTERETVALALLAVLVIWFRSSTRRLRVAHCLPPRPNRNLADPDGAAIHRG